MARCLRSHSRLLSSSDIRGGAVGVVVRQHSSASTRAGAVGNSSDNASISPEHWKSVYRAFLLHVHPDFFHDQPKERAVNEKSLKVLSMHLDALGDDYAYSPRKNNSACLVFFFKATTTTTAVVDPTTQYDHGNDGHNHASVEPEDERPLPRKVMLPIIASDRNSTKVEVRHLLNVAGVSPTPVPLASPSPKPSHQQAPRSSPADSREEDGPDWNDWVEDLFGDTPANRAWDEAAAEADRRSRGRPGGDEDTTSEGRQSRTTWGGAASEQYEHSGGGGGGAGLLGRVLATDAGRALVRERRVSARNVRRLVEELREKHGFGKFTFR